MVTFIPTTSLYKLIISLFVIQIVVVFVIIGYLSYHNGKLAIDELSLQLRTEISSSIEQKLYSYLEVPYLINELTANAVSSGSLDVYNSDSLQQHLWYQSKIDFFAHSVSYIGIGSEKPNYYGVRRLPDGATKFDRLIKIGQHDYLETWFADEYGNLTTVEAVGNRPYDPRNRPWYNLAKEAQAPVWTDIYAYFAGQHIAISANQPLYDSNQHFVGVASTDLILTEISAFLQQMRIGKSGQTFIMERDGKLVTSSNPELANPIRLDEQGKVQKDHADKVLRWFATEVADERISATAQFLAQHFAGFDSIVGTHYLEFYLNGSKEFVKVSTLSDDKGLDWLVVVVVPESDFMARIYQNTVNTMILAILALLVAIIIGIYMAKSIIKPIISLNAAAKRLARGQWEQDLPLQRKDEIGELAHSFNSMGLQLRELVEDLEHKVADRTKKLALAYKKLKTSQAQLVQSEKMASLGQMVAGIAHEINTPLGYVKNNLENSRDLCAVLEQLLVECEAVIKSSANQINSPELNKLLTSIADSYEDELLTDIKELNQDAIHGVQEISNLVLNLKNFSRLDLAAVEDVDIHNCIDSVLNIARNLLKYKVELKLDYAADLPKIVCAPAQINQVLLNIITNAAQAIPEQGKILIKTSFDAKMLHICIQDNGQGMSKEQLRRIFDPFYTTKPIGEGTGLGLSISYQIIQQHKGKISVSSQPGVGSKFIISLPLQS
jgi:signal transduction histidine kinase